MRVSCTSFLIYLLDLVLKSSTLHVNLEVQEIYFMLGSQVEIHVP